MAYQVANGSPGATPHRIARRCNEQESASRSRPPALEKVQCRDHYLHRLRSSYCRDEPASRTGTWRGAPSTARSKPWRIRARCLKIAHPATSVRMSTSTLRSGSVLDQPLSSCCGRWLPTLSSRMIVIIQQQCGTDTDSGDISVSRIVSLCGDFQCQHRRKALVRSGVRCETGEELELPASQPLPIN